MIVDCCRHNLLDIHFGEDRPYSGQWNIRNIPLSWIGAAKDVGWALKELRHKKHFLVPSCAIWEPWVNRAEELSTHAFTALTSADFRSHRKRGKTSWWDADLVICPDSSLWSWTLLLGSLWLPGHPVASSAASLARLVVCTEGPLRGRAKGQRVCRDHVERYLLPKRNTFLWSVRGSSNLALPSNTVS